MKSIVVVGAGTMGAGIAQLAAGGGTRVHLIDVAADLVEKSVAGIHKRFDRLVEKGRMSAEDCDAAKKRLTGSTSIDGGDDVELAIEAVVERMDVKHDVFRKLEGALPSSAILASNTSSLSISEIAVAVADPSRVVGMHFFNPAPLMPLVEIIAGEKSATAAVDAAFDAAKNWGKVPVRAKDTPGFIVNRVARGFYLEALRLLDEGVAGVDEIDMTMRNQGGFRMGPFELMDLIGIDVNLSVSESVYEQMKGHPRFLPSDIQRKLVKDGRLGRKTGRGFYDYSEPDRPLPAHTVERRSFQLTPLLSDAMASFAGRGTKSAATSTEQYIFTRILAAIINEAGHAYSAGVATSDDIDTAMIKGTNYPKGPLEWADEIGHRTVRGVLKGFCDVYEDARYEPAPLFVDAD